MKIDTLKIEIFQQDIRRELKRTLADLGFSIATLAARTNLEIDEIEACFERPLRSRTVVLVRICVVLGLENDLVKILSFSPNLKVDGE